ncbi:MAG: AMP-binding protein [Myxococcota bacterium]
MSDWYTKRCFGDLPEEAAQRWGEREALYFQGQRWSYRELADEVDRATRALLALGVAPGEKVGLWLPNRPEWVFLMFALARAGAVQIPINTRLRSYELRYILEQSGTTSLISCERSGPANLLAVAREVLPGIETQDPESLSYPDLPAFRRFVAVGDCQHAGVLRWDELLARGGDIGDAALAERAAGIDPDDPLFIMYTSGTTGFPKGVVHNHNIIRNVEDRANRMAVTQDDVILTFLPLFHAFAYSEGAVSSIVTGARQVLTETFDAEECLDLIAQEGASLTFGFDTHFKDLLEAQERKARDTHSLRTALLAAGMQSSTPIARRANEVFCPTITGYGMTECYVGVSLSFPTSNLSQRIESSGYPAPGYEIRVVDPDTGRDQPADVQGEIWVRGYGVMEEYYEKPEETAKAIDSEGWLHTGDTGILRQDGYLRFLGRYKDMLKVGGENVDPMEVEGFLLEHPAIRQVAVVGYPDARLSEVPVAFVELVASSSLTPDEVIAHCKGRIAGFKVPRHVLLVKEFPTTATGKIQKVVLREQALQQIPQTPRA